MTDNPWDKMPIEAKLPAPLMRPRLNGAIKDEDHDELAVWLDDDLRLQLAARD
jgi:hypothetical protein